MSLYIGLHIFTQLFFAMEHGAAGGKKSSNFGRKPSISLFFFTQKIGSLRSPDHASPLFFFFHPPTATRAWPVSLPYAYV